MSILKEYGETPIVSNFSFFYGKGGSGYIRGEQMADYLGGKKNPTSGYEEDICIYVKVRPPKDHPKRTYLDVDDAPQAVEWLKENKDTGVIAISVRAKRKLEERLGRKDIVLIPHQHCNFERWVRPERPVKVVGIIGSFNCFQYPIDEFREELREIGLELRYETGGSPREYWETYKSDDKTSMREKVCEFHKGIDIQVVWRPRSENSIKDDMRNPNKLGNAASFGIPTVSYPEKNFEEEWSGLYLPANTIKQMIFQLKCLKDSAPLYKDYAMSGLLRAENYHIDNIAELYRKL